MNKKVIIIIVFIIIIGILLFPIKYYVKDGGSYGYRAILYDITFWKGTEGSTAEEKYGNITLRILFFEFNFNAK